MTRQWYSVEQVAELLELHVKTVRGYVRDGRLNAVRVGKQYRISREDLAEFTGGAPEPVRRTRHVEASSIVQVDAISRESTDRLTTLVMAALRGEPDDEPLRVETVYDEERASLKIILIGGVRRTAALLAVIESVVDQI
jgi:excisionase family DNA binding protein